MPSAPLPPRRLAGDSYERDSVSWIDFEARSGKDMPRTVQCFKAYCISENHRGKAALVAAFSHNRLRVSPQIRF